MVRNPPQKKIFRTSKRTRCLCRHCDRTLNTNSRLQSILHGLGFLQGRVITSTLEIEEVKDFHLGISVNKTSSANWTLVFRLPIRWHSQLEHPTKASSLIFPSCNQEQNQ